MNYNKIIIVLAIILAVVVIAGIVALNPFPQKTQSAVNITSTNELNIDDNFSISLTDKNGTPIANQTVNITFINSNGTKIIKQVNTDNAGNGVIALGDMLTGQYSVNVTYIGNDNYLNCSASQQLTIKEKVTESASSTSQQSKTYPSGLTDEEIEANIQRDLDIRAKNGVKGGYDYQEARSFYQNVPKEGMI